MRFYEIRVIAPQGETARDIQTRARSVASSLSRPMKVISATVHARPTEGYRDRWDAAIFVLDESPDSGEDDPEFHEFAGKMARIHGRPVVNWVKFGEYALSLKGDPKAVQDFINNALDTGIDLDRDDLAETEFATNPHWYDEEYEDDDDEEEETFEIEDPEDEADT